MRAAVVHPDLGLGGAERLIVDATCALLERGVQTEVFTSYYDQRRCFQETRHFDIVVLGSWIPRSIRGRFCALLAYLKMIYIAVYLVFRRRQLDFIICDQVSACIPILKLALRRTKIVFYCHFPDQLLTTRETALKSIYRKPLDKLEEWSTGLADHILVNSRYTSRVVKETFKSLADRELEVLYPCVRINKNQSTSSGSKKRDQYVFISLNRFERKKNIGLAIEALSECLPEQSKVHLIIAGGYDERLRECVEYFDELVSLVEKLELNSHVTFVKSPDDHEKENLLQSSDAVIYTPVNEHFGIVPLEAMLLRKPVIASASGGPLETIQSELTGILCEANKEAFAEAMRRLVLDPKLGQEMGKAGFERVVRSFSFDVFGDKLIEICRAPSRSALHIDRRSR